jgi:hypothetical protein
MIKLSVYRKYAKKWNRSRYEDLFQSHEDKDQKAFRIYLPFKSKSRPPHVPAAIKNELDSKGYQVECYLSGVAKSKTDPRRKMKIGKLIATNTKLKKKFDNDPVRNGAKKIEKMIVISRHPLDIIKMSTDRGWSSCMNLKDGCNRRYIKHDVSLGSLIAYQIDSDDKSIKRPAGRILIKPYVNLFDKTSSLMVCEGSAYGMPSPGFTKLVDAWVDKNNEGKYGVFKFNPKMYDDQMGESVIYRLPKKIETKEHVALILNEFYRIKNYTINDDLSVDVKGSVDLRKGLVKNISIDSSNHAVCTKILVKFRHVSGNFNCSDMYLNSLKNAPETVGKSFYCYSNQLSSLKYFPKSVGKDIDVSNYGGKRNW